MTNLIRGILLKLVYPLLMLIAAFWKGRREALQLWVIRMNNRLVRAGGYRADSMLILLPHCLQISDCEVRITNSILNCRRCGRCGISGLIDIAERNSVKLFVATGGTIARRIIKESRPQGIVAVACERDLSSGIVDTYPMPVIGVLNERPKGPCLDTLVDMAQVEEAIRFFAGRGKEEVSSKE